MALQNVLFMMDGYGMPRYTHNRNDTDAKFTDIDGVLQDVSGADELRREWLWLDTWALGNLPDTPAILIGDGRTNLNDDDDLTNWTATGTPVVTGSVSDPAGGTGAYTVEDNDVAAEEFIHNDIGTASVDSCVFVVRENTHPASGGTDLTLYDQTAGTTRCVLNISAWSNGEPTVSATIGVLIGKRYVGNGYWAIYGQSSGSTGGNTHLLRVHPASSAAETGSIDIYRINAFDDQVPAYSILDASETLNTEDLYVNWPYTPREMTLYAKFNEWDLEGGNSGRIFQISDNANSDPRLLLWRSGSGNYQLFHDTGSSSVTSTATPGHSYGDTIELRSVLNADGSVQLHYSVNGGAEGSASASAALTLGSAWSGSRLYLGSNGVPNTGMTALIALKAVEGSQSMAYMRSLDPMFALGGMSVPIASGSAREVRTEIGDRARTFDGTMRETIRSRVSGWSAETIPLNTFDSNKVRVALEQSTQPQQAFGTLIQDSTGGILDVFTKVDTVSPVQSGTTRMETISFSVEESS